MSSQLQSEVNIVFGTGPLGLSVMEELVSRGRQVTLVNRSGVLDEVLPSGVAVVQGDATNAAEVTALCQSADVVFMCAQPEYFEWPEKFPPIVEGIIEGLSQTEARLVMGDNLYMYGPTHGRPLTENLPYAATGPKGKTRAHMAQSILDAHAAGKITATIGRASDFYGPRVEGSAVGDIFFGPALGGKAVNVMGDPTLPYTYTYIRDFARGLVTLSEHEIAFGRAWHVASGETISTREFADLVAEEVGRPVKLRPAGKLMLAVAGLFVKEIREFGEMSYEFTEPFVMDDSQFRQAFGGEVTPHREAIRETVAWYRAQSALLQPATSHAIG